MAHNIIYSGCKPGERCAASYGANRGTAVLDLTVECIATVGARRIALTGDLLVLWHQGDAGTFHGWYDPAAFAACPNPCRGADPYNYPPEERATKCLPIAPEGAVSESSSGSGQAVAAVVKIPAGGILYVTSGYDGRNNWTVHTVRPDGLRRESLQAYRARNAVVESLA